MSVLSLRGRTAVLAVAVAFAMPLGVALAGSASAATVPDVPAVSGLLGNVTGGSLLSGDAGGLLSTVTGLVGGGSASSAVDDALAGTPAAGLTDTVTGLVPAGAATGTLLPRVGETVDKALTTATDTVDRVVDTATKAVDTTVSTVDRLVPGLADNGNNAVKGATKPAKTTKTTTTTTTVATGALPHTGADPNTTALLLCAGLAVAGAGVTLVTRRRNGLGLHAAR